MESKALMISSRIMSGIVFLAVCLFGAIAHSQDEKSAAMLSIKPVGLSAHLQLHAIENDTPGCEFQAFYGSGAALAYVFPQSSFMFVDSKSLLLLHDKHLIIKCVKGSFLPVFIQQGGHASGQVKDGYHGPYYLSMWLGYPQVPENSKVHVRYMVKNDVVGKIGIKIGAKGDYRFVAYEDVEFLV